MGTNSDSDDSDYVVENYVTPDTIRAPRNDESADILKNFSDTKSDDEEQMDVEPEEVQEESEGEEVYDEYDTTKTANGDDTAEDKTGEDQEDKPVQPSEQKSKEVKVKLSETEINNLLRGSSNKNRFVLYVTNLNFETTKEQLKEFFSSVGEVKNVRIPPKRRGGFAFVEMCSLEGFKKALEFHNTELHGRHIKIQISEGGKKKSANKKNILKQKNRKLSEMRNENKTFTKSGKNYDKSIKKEKEKEMLARKRWRKPKPRMGT